MTVKQKIPVCKLCGSTDVVKDAWAYWNFDTQDWEIQYVFDDTFCNSCQATDSDFNWFEKDL